GLILNLMPCVFPVLSIKSVSLIEARGAVARRQRAHALSYTAGVLLAFAALAGALLALRAGGRAVGWGFQLQQPVFVAALAYLMFAMALSMSGVVQFGVRLMGVGQSLAATGGYRGSFFTGVLAVLVATPCTVPFMGTALGYALTQPPAIAVAVFLALGLGMALPFLLLGYFPRLGAWLPKPGAWMETFKQAMAFPLYLSVAWLLWVLGGLSSRDGMALAAVGLVLLAFALWLWPRRGALAGTLKLAALAAALALLAAPPLRAVPATPAPMAAAAHESYTPQRLQELRSQGRTVFVNFTADWCLTCKFNERVALDNDAVRAAFAAHDVVWLTGDWTRYDPEITATLQRFGRSGVPLYLLYPKGGAPEVLPQLLTPAAVIDALPSS
ncbi:MAG: thioredoxin family protein, partial [Sinobacteraceae bacterium]|nr:thioredoxin family protein [Nevskiaceae bacterium]